MAVRCNTDVSAEVRTVIFNHTGTSVPDTQFMRTILTFNRRHRARRKILRRISQRDEHAVPMFFAF